MNQLATTLRDLAEQAANTTSSDLHGALEIGEVYRLLDVRGVRNTDLANPLNRDPNVYYFRPRESPLSGDEPVYGEVLSLTYSAHDPFVFLEDHDSMRSLEDLILSNQGIVNPFTTFLIPYIDFRAREYRIAFRDRDGKTALFSKRLQYLGMYHLREEYEHRKLEWTTL